MAQKNESELPIDCRVHIENFEGPLDLLLHLIKTHELDLLNLQLSQVTEQYLNYLGYMRELNLDLASEYLVMAATLTHLKSQIILPQESKEEKTGPDPRAALIEQLLQLKCYKDLADHIQNRPRLFRNVFFLGHSGTEDIKAEIDPEVALTNPYQMVEAYKSMLRRQREIVHEVYEDSVPVSECLKTVVERFATEETFSLNSLLPQPSQLPHLISNFLAVLELTKLQVAHLEQKDIFGPIHVKRKMDPEALEKFKEERLSLSW